jgi:hypothetical protein
MSQWSPRLRGLPHLGLAHQYLNHFNCKSEYEELLSRTALQVGVRKGMVDAMGNSQAGPVVLGPNTCMDRPSDASFEFVEIRARTLAEHRAWLQILDDTMRRDALIPSQNRGAGGLTVSGIGSSGEPINPQAMSASELYRASFAVNGRAAP